MSPYSEGWAYSFHPCWRLVSFTHCSTPGTVLIRGGKTEADGRIRTWSGWKELPCLLWHQLQGWCIMSGLLLSSSAYHNKRTSSCWFQNILIAVPDLNILTLFLYIVILPSTTGGEKSQFTCLEKKPKPFCPDGKAIGEKLFHEL